ncbi:MAG: cysteine hydrolase [Candidatus Cloacimonetes bacterium]|nr:cysteine hydrolase [Candidatus Cloacimonadota bacterium]
MKEQYFTSETIEQKSKQMLEKVRKYISEQKFRFIPARSTLLVVDMQDYFIKELSHAYVPSIRTIIPRIKKLIDAYSKYNFPVIFTRHLNTKQNANLMSKWWNDLITEENPLSQISAEFDISKGIVLKKSQYDAFYETSLEKILREKEISQIVICGVMTHLCCETTTRSAFIRGFEVFFTIDCTATYNENFHLSSLMNLAHGFAIPVLSNEIIKSVLRK